MSASPRSHFLSPPDFPTSPLEFPVDLRIVASIFHPEMFPSTRAYLDKHLQTFKRVSFVAGLDLCVEAQIAAKTDHQLIADQEIKNQKVFKQKISKLQKMKKTKAGKSTIVMPSNRNLPLTRLQKQRIDSKSARELL